MIALDTNVLVRFLVEDASAPEQCRRAREIVGAAVADGDVIFVSVVVLVESVWVMARAARLGRAEIAEVLRGLLDAEQFDLDEREAVEEALSRFAQGSGDFSDYLLGVLAEQRGASVTWTFDAKLGGAAGFKRA